MVRIREIAPRHLGAAVWLFVMAAGPVVGFAQLAAGQTCTTLYSFKGMPDGNSPEAKVLRDTQGNLYGTTVFGGSAGQGTVCNRSCSSNGCGVIFEISPAGKETILYVIPEYQIFGSLTMDSSGNSRIRRHPVEILSMVPNLSSLLDAWERLFEDSAAHPKRF